MNVLIEKQAAIDALNRYYSDKKYITRSRTILSAICLDIKCTLRDLPAANRWIPCRERLPELRKWVLCQCRAGIIDVLRLNEEGDWVKLYPNTIYMNGFVTAWMPLPEPYREEEEDGND